LGVEGAVVDVDAFGEVALREEGEGGGGEGGG